MLNRRSVECLSVFVQVIFLLLLFAFVWPNSLFATHFHIIYSVCDAAVIQAVMTVNHSGISMSQPEQRSDKLPLLP